MSTDFSSGHLGSREPHPRSGSELSVAKPGRHHSHRGGSCSPSADEGGHSHRRPETAVAWTRSLAANPRRAQQPVTPGSRPRDTTGGGNGNGLWPSRPPAPSWNRSVPAFLSPPWLTWARGAAPNVQRLSWTGDARWGA
jgi:hypothetical protein